MAIPTPRIIRSHRLSISIHVTRNGELVVKAPKFAPDFMIRNFLSEKEDWIEKTMQKVHTRLPQRKKYSEGEEFYFLGTPRTLTFYNGTTIIVKGTKLLFPKALQFRLQKELGDWFVRQAKDTIMQRLEVKSQEMHATFGSVRFSDTSSKWGTCFPDNSLQFNWRLIMAPLMVLDYVVIHELSHTTEKNHSDSFWRKVRQYTPAYRQHRKWLNDNAHLLTV